MLSGIESDDFTPQNTVNERFTVPVILDFILEEVEAKKVNLALDLILSREKEELSRSQALLCLARFYLERCKEQTGSSLQIPGLASAGLGIAA